MENPITKLREDRNLSRAEMSRQTGIFYNTLMFLEQGKPAAMRKCTLESLSEFTQIQPEQLQADYANWKLNEAHKRA